MCSVQARARAPPGPSMQSDWNDHDVSQEVVLDDREPRVSSRMDPPQRPVVPMPGPPVVDFPLDPQEEDSDDDVTVVGSDDEQEAAAQSTLQEEVPRQDVPEAEEVPHQDVAETEEAPRQDVPVNKEKVNYDPNASEIITIED